MYYSPEDPEIITPELVTRFGQNPDLFISAASTAIGETALEKIHSLSSELVLLNDDTPRFTECFTYGRIVGAISIQERIGYGALHESLSAEFGAAEGYGSDLLVALGKFDHLQKGAEVWFDHSGHQVYSRAGEMAKAMGSTDDVCKQAFMVGIGSIAAIANIVRGIKLSEGLWPLHSCAFSSN